MEKEKLCGMTSDEIFNLISPGFTRSHALSISNNIYKKKVPEISMITGIPHKLKKTLENIVHTGLFMPVASMTSADGSVKYLFRTSEGKKFETVYIPDLKRNTVCVSTQSGCRMGCRYCFTGQYGFHGNLTTGEIINQIISIPEYYKVNRVVFMGMGEPMDNLDNVLKACEIITAEWGLAISPRNVTVSSVGITPGIEEFLRSSKCNFTLSLHTPFEEDREKVVPVEKKYPFRKILEIMKSQPVNKKRRLSIAYMMIKDHNDSELHLEELKTILKNSNIRVNLLPYHNAGNEKSISASDDRMNYFKHNLVISGISASIRKSRGIDISAACGLLAKESGISD
jgi:23S rRNA (adenine2503-C2)-methyltransferase